MSVAQRLAEAMGTELLPRFPYCPREKRVQLLQRIDSHMAARRRHPTNGAKVDRTKVRYSEIDLLTHLPYNLLVESYDGGTVRARVLELPGCEVECDNEEDLDDMVADAIVEWAWAAWQDGEEVPMPYA